MAKKNSAKNSTNKAKNNVAKGRTKTSAKRRTSPKGKGQYNKRYPKRTPQDKKQTINIYVVNDKEKDKDTEDEKRYKEKHEEMFQIASGGSTSSDRGSERYERIKRKKDIGPKQAKIKRLKAKKGITQRVVPAKVKVSSGSSSGFRLVKLPIIILLCLTMLFGMRGCKKGEGGKGLIEAPTWLENILPTRPSWLPKWFPTLFKGGNVNTEGSDGDDIIYGEDGLIDSNCIHVDEDKNGYCDKCGVALTVSGDDNSTVFIYTITFNANGGELSTAETTRTTTADGYLMSAPGAYLYGYKFIGWYTAIDGGELVEILNVVFTADCTLYAHYELACIHIDEDLDEHCDICGVKYYCLHIDEDGDNACDKCGFEIPEDDDTENDNPSECEHIDGNADKFCDLCGAVMQDGEGGDPSEPDKPIEPSECAHRDGNDDGVCDNCGTGFEDGCNHRDSDDNGKCDKCEESYSDFCDNHKDRNDDGKCDNCGTGFEDGCDLHRDKNDDGYCDKCDIEYDDGEEPCQHRDGNDDGKCDYCGQDFEDSIEDTASDISNLSTLYDGNERLMTGLHNFTYSYKWGENGQALEDIGTVSTSGNFKIAILFENEYFRDYFLTDGSPAQFMVSLNENEKYIDVVFAFDYSNDMGLYDIASISMQTALFDKTKTGNYAKIRDSYLITNENTWLGGERSFIVGGALTLPIEFLTESNNCLIITVKASPLYDMSELVDNSQSGSITGGVNPFRPYEFCGFTLDGKMRVYMHTTFDYILTGIKDKDGNVIYEYDERYPFGKVIEIDMVEELQDPFLILTADSVENRKDYGPVYGDDYAQVEDFAYVTVRYNLNGFDIDVHMATVHVPILDEEGNTIHDENGWNGWKCVSLFDFYFDLPEGASGSNITVWNENNSTSEKYSELMLDIVTSNATWGYILYDYSEASNIVVEIEILAERIQMVLKNEKE